MKKTTEEFVEELKKSNPTITVLDNYIDARTPLSVSCNECGNIWKVAPTNLLRGRRCPVCSYKLRGLKHRITDDEYRSRLQSINPDIELLESYTTSEEYILVKCRTCPFEWRVDPQGLLHGNGCPKCAHTGTSFIEQTILLSLRKLCSYDVIWRDRSAIGMELDIYIPSIGVAIEYGAWPWHENKIEKDDKKRQLCEAHNILLIQIFDAYTGMETDNNQQWYYRENLGRKNNAHLVKALVIRVCERIGGEFTLSDEEYKAILNEARANSRKLTTDRLNKQLEELGSKVVVLSDYQDMLTKVLAECKECGHQWKVIPASLKRGLGCPVCGVRRRSGPKKTTEEFKKVLNDINPDIEIIGEYLGRHKSVMVKCLKHNRTWNSVAGSLLRGSGCPTCRIEKISSKQRKTHSKFIEEVKKENPYIDVIGEYVNQKTKVNVRCKRCGNCFLSWPDTLLHGGGCPVCARAATVASHVKRVKCVETGIVYDSITEAKRETGINTISNCCNGKQETAGGFRWEFVNSDV